MQGSQDDHTNSALLAGSRWGDGSGKTVLSYSFADADSRYTDAARLFDATRSSFSAADQATTRSVLAAISQVCNLDFVEVTEAGGSPGTLRFAYSAYPNQLGYAGFGYFPSALETGGDVWIGLDQADPQWAQYRPFLILHETLHAIGLKHPADASSTMATTVMSYAATPGSHSGALSSYPAQPMPADVAALQALYGAAAHNPGDTRYDLSGPQWQTFCSLWDSSGIDTLDATACRQGVTLDLQAGARSDVGASVIAFNYSGAAGDWRYEQSVYTDTLAICAGCAIENAAGSAFDDVLLGNGADNILDGGAGDDHLDGRGGNDVLRGGSGKDIFKVSSGNNRIDGEAGHDTVVFLGQRSAYRIEEASGQAKVVCLADGSVTGLTHIERVEFSDAVLATQAGPDVLPTGSAGQAIRLYRAALDRMPDASGLTYQTQALESGTSLRDMASQFMASAEFNTRFGQPGNAEFVRSLYRNVFDRDPDAQGLAFHLGHLESGAAARADLLVAFSESPENQAALVGLGQASLSQV